MALLPILHFPDPRLRKVAAAVDHVDARVRRLVEDMLATMYHAPGIGLAAPQVNVLQRVITIDLSEHHDQPLCLINPEVIATEGAVETEEGCLSVPEVYETVRRAEWVRVRALDVDGNPCQIEAEGLLAVCIQHEIDHLDGKLFVDYLSQFKRQRIRKRARRDQRLAL